jgi:cell division septal protein FtsQ
MRKKKKRKRIKRLIILLGAICCLGAGTNYLHHFLVSSPYFNLNKIEIVGTRFLQKKVIQNFLGLNTGINIISLDLRSLNQKLLHHPWIKGGAIRRLLPNGIIVSIVEREPVAHVDMGRKYFVATDGKILTPLKSTEGLRLPLITGLGKEDGIRTKLKKGAEILTILNSSSSIATMDIGRLDLSLIDRPVVFLKGDFPEIRFSFKHLKQNLSYFSTISPFISKEEKGIAYIDFSFKDLIVVKPL